MISQQLARPVVAVVAGGLVIAACATPPPAPVSTPTLPAATPRPAATTVLTASATVTPAPTVVTSAGTVPTGSLPATPPAATDGPPAGATPVAFGPPDCPVTPAYALPPRAAPKDFPAPTWYVNPERTIWAGLAPPYLGKWYAGLGQKVRWWRRGPLQVEGRRLDGPAPPLVAAGEGQSLDRPLPTPDPAVPTPVSGGGQASSITIPTPGCWEMTARTPRDLFRFVVYAYPLDYAPAGPPFSRRDPAGTLAQHVATANAVVLGEVVGSTRRDGAFLGQELRIVQAWKGPVTPGNQVTVLQDQNPPGSGPPLLETGRQYLLFLERRPQGWWRLTTEYGYGVVEAGRVRAARAIPGAQFWQWQDEPLAEVDATLRRLTAGP